MKKIYQTEIMIYFGKNLSDITFTRRNNETRQYTDKTYKPTQASRTRLEKTISKQINRGLADISITGNCLFVEPTS